MSHSSAGTRSEGPLVTVLGASGFVGSSVVAELARRPLRLRAVSRGPAAIPAGACARIEAHTADVTVPSQLRSALAGSDVVVDLLLPTSGWRGHGGEDGERTTVGVMRDLLDYFADVGSRPTVLFAGSSSQVGVPARLPVDGTETDHPCTPYDRNKLAAERLLTSASLDNVVHGATLRLSTVFGCGPKAGAVDRGVLASMTRRALAGEPLTVWQQGEVRRDFVHVADVAAAFASAMDHAGNLSPGHWLIGSGQSHSLHDVFHAISGIVSELTGRPPVEILSVPPPAEATPTDLHSMMVDTTAFRSITGWRPQVSLATGLSELVADMNRRSGNPGKPAMVK